MRTYSLILLSLLCFLGVSAQNSNVILFTEQGEKFTVILNGLRINEKPVTNLKISDLNAPQYKLKVIFENKALGEMDKNLFCNAGTETSWSIKKNNKGEYKLAMVSDVPIAQAPPPASNQTVIVYGAPAPSGVTGSSQTTVTEQTVTTTQTNATSGNQGNGGVGINMNVTDPVTGENLNINMGVNVNGNNAGMNMNVGGVTTSGSVTTTTTTTTTTSSSSGTLTTGNAEPAPAVASGCYPMSGTAFETGKSSIKSKSFEDSKLTVAKQMMGSNCLSSAQVKEVMGLFDFEKTKLDFAKFAYSKCSDPNNYFMVNDAFDFEGSIDELNKYIGH